MVRIYTEPHVTFMKHEHTLWNWANKKLIGKSVSDYLLSVLLKSAVTIRSPQSSAPKPTCFCFFNPSPKQRADPARTGATTGTEITPAFCYIADVNSKRRATKLACSWYGISSQDVNLRGQVSFWSGSFAAQTVCGPSNFNID